MFVTRLSYSLRNTEGSKIWTGLGERSLPRSSGTLTSDASSLLRLLLDPVSVNTDDDDDDLLDDLLDVDHHSPVATETRVRTSEAPSSSLVVGPTPTVVPEDPHALDLLFLFCPVLYTVLGRTPRRERNRT